MNQFSLALFTFVTIGLVACSESADSAPETITDSTQQSVQAGDKSMATMTISGKLIYQQHEGGFLGFIANDGAKYTLRGIDKAYRKNGMILTLSGSVRNDIMTTRQFGSVFEVKEVLSSDSSQVTEKPGVSII
ncbi:hypothetical protein [Aestuariibacter sp. A3R04]|uniref:hypothetical protein n=1 Tax=Aestuariibacter sp. A3R04 TaxID=2841571 RepID=UPI001C082C58|nr:hypothetical protein [Aestuariibacter sp. A3R04]MBU3022574.1 hypothetical protein [Aestuariibacter sp. A3R04]